MASHAPLDPAGRRGPAARGLLVRSWRRWWVKLLAIVVLLAVAAYGVLWVTIIRDLPSVDALRTYEPPLPTNIRGSDGTPVYTYARERRVELSYAEYPTMLVRAFLAAEDKGFFEHHGVDYSGVAGAVVDYARKYGTGRRAKGGSTITQQVAKNLLIGNEYSPSRKLKEALLAYKIEDALTKPQILELYLNTIALGRNSFGVEAASHAYFDKELPQLSVAQMAYLAILPKGPANYDPFRDTDRALARRNYVLGEMLKNGFITRASHDEAVGQPIGAILRQTPKFEKIGGYFVEEVRRQLIDRFGESERDGPYSVYSGGLWVRTSLDPAIQGDAETALRDGLLRFDRGRGWGGPLRHVDITSEDGASQDGVGDGRTGGAWLQAMLNTNISINYADWRAAIVVGKDASGATIGFATGETAALPRWGAQMPVRGV
uniref:transglycosylase domain-containing protein n=1 Tax=Sphingomonas bacterium TaxID=1895847 RepID=UPI0015757AB6